MANRLQKQPVVTYVPGIRAVPGRAAFCETKRVITGWKKISQPKYGAGGGGSSSSSSSTPSFISVETLISGGISIPPGAVAVYKPVPNTGGGLNAYNQELVGYSIPKPSGSSGPSGGGYGGSGQDPIYGYETTCYPAIEGVAGVPARMDYSDNNGWNGGARSIAEIPVGHYFEITLPDNPLGVMIGLSDGRFDHTYGHSSHALVARPSGITPVEHGLDVGAEVPSGSRIRIARNEATVQMFVDGELVHTSHTPAVGTIYADATLYGVSDYVDDPIIGQIHELSGVAAMALMSYLDVTPGGVAELLIHSDGVAVLNGVALASGTAYTAIQSDGQARVRHEIESDADLLIQSEVTGFGAFSTDGEVSQGIAYAHGRAALVGHGGDRATGRASGVFSRPTLEARINRPEAEVVQAIGVFPPPLLTALMHSGGLLSASGSQSAAGKASEAGYFGGVSPAATVYQLVAWESYLPDDQLDGGESVFGLDVLWMESVLLFALYEGVELNDSLDLYLVVSLDMYEAMSVDGPGSLSLAAIIELALRERMAVTGSAYSARREALQYAVNAVTGAVARYENFGFKQFATVGASTYAIKSDGLYRLEGSRDNGAPLDAVIDFGASDFGTAQSKRVNSIYAGIATDGDVYLRVTGDDGAERVYRAVAGANEARALTAKGLAARHWRVRLELCDASYADLDNVEIEIGASQRRLRR